MRTILIAAAAGAAGLGALAIAQPMERPCCELWIFESANGPDSYAIRALRSGRTFVVLSSPTGAQLLEGDAARKVVRRWTAVSRLAASTSILLDARESRIDLGVDVADPPDAPGNDDGDTLVLIRNASPAQTRKFIADMPQLTAAARTHLSSAATGE
jgi:hypothetical protein